MSRSVSVEAIEYPRIFPVYREKNMEKLVVDLPILRIRLEHTFILNKTGDIIEGYPAEAHRGDEGGAARVGFYGVPDLAYPPVEHIGEYLAPE